MYVLREPAFAGYEPSRGLVVFPGGRHVWESLYALVTGWTYVYLYLDRHYLVFWDSGFVVPWSRRPHMAFNYPIIFS